MDDKEKISEKAEKQGLTSLLLLSLGYVTKLKGEEISRSNPNSKIGFSVAAVALCAASAFEGFRALSNAIISSNRNNSR